MTSGFDSSNYTEVTVKSCPQDLYEDVTLWMWNHGALGISENLPYVQELRRLDVTELPADVTDLVVYFTDPWTKEMATDWAERFGLEALQEVKPSLQWQENWKQHFSSMHLGRGVWLVPSWEEPPDDAQAVLRLDPGMAFGTGTHETTAMVLDVLARRFFAGQSLIDVGTGSGILSLFAERLKASEVIGIDNDPIAVEVARQNAHINHSNVSYELSGAALNTQSFDWVVANIIDGVLVDIADQLFAYVKRRGYLLVSGILVDRVSEFLKEFPVPQHFRLAEQQTQGEWVCFLWRSDES